MEGRGGVVYFAKQPPRHQALRRIIQYIMEQEEGGGLAEGEGRLVTGEGPLFLLLFLASP